MINYNDLLDVLLELWNIGKFGCSFHGFLGWTEEEYAKWLEEEIYPDHFPESFFKRLR